MPTPFKVAAALLALWAAREYLAYRRRTADLSPEAVAAHGAMETYQRLAEHFGRRAIDAELRYYEVTR